MTQAHNRLKQDQENVLGYLAGTILLPYKTVTALKVDTNLSAVAVQMVLLNAVVIIMADIVLRVLSVHEQYGRSISTNIIAIIGIVLLYPAELWVWLKVFGFQKQKIDVQAFIIMSYAFSIVFFLFNFVLEITKSLSGKIGGEIESISLFFSMIFISYLCSISLKIGLMKALGLNLLSILVLTLVAVVIGVVLYIILHLTGIVVPTAMSVKT